MRLSVLPNISTKDGTSNKNARLTNMLKVSGPKDIAEIRPGLVDSATTTGAAGGLVSFNDELISVYGTTLGKGIEPESPDDNTANQYTDVATTMLFYNCLLYVNSEFLAFAYDDDEGLNFLVYGDGSSFSLPDYSAGDNTGANEIYGAATDGSVVCLVGGGFGILYSSTSAPSSYAFTIATYSSPLTDTNLYRCDYVNDRFVALAKEAATDHFAIFWSTNAESSTWSASAKTAGVLYGVCHDGTTYRFYGSTQDAAGGTPIGYTTTDFVTFSSAAVSFPSGVEKVYRSAYISGTYFCYAYNGAAIVLYSSTDGLTFSAVTESNVTTFNAPNSMLHVADGYLYAIADPVPTDASGSHVFRTADGATWTDYASLATATASSVAIGASTGVAIDYGNDIWWQLANTGTGGNTIPALSTIASGNYDFAQSVI